MPTAASFSRARLRVRHSKPGGQKGPSPLCPTPPLDSLFKILCKLPSKSRAHWLSAQVATVTFRPILAAVAWAKGRPDSGSPCPRETGGRVLCPSGLPRPVPPGPAGTGPQNPSVRPRPDLPALAPPTPRPRPRPAQPAELPAAPAQEGGPRSRECLARGQARYPRPRRPDSDRAGGTVAKSWSAGGEGPARPRAPIPLFNSIPPRKLHLNTLVQLYFPP